MLHLLAITTALLVIISGLTVIALGNWHRFGLKFAGVCLSTTAAFWLIGADIIFGGNILGCPAEIDPSVCITFEIYHIVRNTAFIIFHIAIGRDAIEFKKHDRRGTLCRKNSTKLSPLS